MKTNFEELELSLAQRGIATIRARNGLEEPLNLEKMANHLKKLQQGLTPDGIDLDLIIQKVARGMTHCMNISDIIQLLAETCAYHIILHPDYNYLAARILIHDLHMRIDENYLNVVEKLFNHRHNDQHCPLVLESLYEFIKKNEKAIQAAFQFERDYAYDYLAFKTMERSYLIQMNDVVMERPQHMLMRVALTIWGEDLENGLKCYRLLSDQYYIHASPTLFNAGTRCNQLSSCYLVEMESDSLVGIYSTLKKCAQISKSAGGVGIAVHCIRGNGSVIVGSRGISNGLVPMLKVYNDSSRNVSQGAGKRKANFSIYLEPWHPDILEFLELRKNHGNEEYRARDLFYGLWIPDLFMERVFSDTKWTLMCPDECKGLFEVYGDEFKQLYEKYEQEGRGTREIQARTLWKAIIDAQIETGMPYMLFKDSINKKSNQMNVGIIKQSNLCAEIVEHTNKNEIAVCNLASISLPACINSDGTYNFEKLIEISKFVTRSLNRVIDVNRYPHPATATSNFRHRPLGVGVQGLADVFYCMKIPFDSPEAQELNEKIFEAIYFGGCTASMELAKEHGPYETFWGSPASKGQLQFHLWNYQPKYFEWSSLIEDIKRYGLRNSLITAIPPTAATS